MVVIVEVIHQCTADIEDAHSTIDQLIKPKFCLLHINRYNIFIEYRVMLEVWICCKFQCILSNISRPHDS